MKYTDRIPMRTGIVCVLLSALAAMSPALDLKAKSALILEDRTGVVLYAKDADAIRYPASITKILTAILLLEHTEPDEVIVAPIDCEKVEGASLHLKPFERVTAHDLLKAILLRSANDACHALAVHVSGSDLEFAKLMNERAKEIGCVRSNFVAPHGLPNDKHYVTARDMGLIAREAMKFPEIREIVEMRKASISRSINTKDLLMVSKNKWLGLDKSAEGIKTGYTKVSGSTFVGAATRNGFRVITVILGSEDWLGDQQKMVNWAYANCTRTAPMTKGEEVGTLPVLGGSKIDVRVSIGADVQYAHLKTVEPGFSKTLTAKEALVAPIQMGDEVGSITYEDAKGWKTTVPVFAVEAVDKSALRAAMSPTWIFGVLALGGSTIWIRRKSRKMYKTTL